jgi:hypothetical protein
MDVGIIIMGSVCIAGNIVTLLTLGRLWDPKGEHVKRMNALLLGTIGTMPTILFVSLFLLMGDVRERNIEQRGYERGIQQQWEQRVDTVYIPIKTR